MNVVAIFGMMIFAYKIRRQLIDLSIKLDANNITPSDYGVIVFGLPKEKTESDLKMALYERFKPYIELHDFEIVYINYCFNIAEFIEDTANLSAMYKRRALIKVYKKRYMKKHNLIKEQVNEGDYPLPPPIR